MARRNDVASVLSVLTEGLPQLLKAAHRGSLLIALFLRVPMPPQKADNDAERLERLKARLAQLHAAGQQAIARCQETREKAEALLCKTRPKAS